MLFASSALVATTRAETMTSIADFIMAIIKMMRGEKVADDLPLTKCGLCEEGGKHDGSKFSLRPVCGAQRIFQSEICEVVPKNRRRKRIPSSPLFEKNGEYSSFLKQLPMAVRTKCISFCVHATAENIF